jgi:hypothetical protein
VHANEKLTAFLELEIRDLRLRRICFGKRDAVPGNFDIAPNED